MTNVVLLDPKNVGVIAKISEGERKTPPPPISNGGISFDLATPERHKDTIFVTILISYQVIRTNVI